MFYSTFEVLSLSDSGLMETRRAVSPRPILYVMAGPVSNVLGQVPLMQLSPWKHYADYPALFP